jgi:signal transduction histidine kinase
MSGAPASAVPATPEATRTFAHDLDNLLAIVIGNLDLMDERPELDAETRQLLRASLDAALRGAELVRGLRR